MSSSPTLKLRGSQLRFVFRCDASIEIGAGHLTRSLALAKFLRALGHHVFLITNKSDLSWVENYISESRITVTRVPKYSLDQEMITRMKPDWVIVDSYKISSTRISELNELVPVLAIIDGDARGIGAELYLDQNINAENSHWPAQVRQRLLSGSKFTIIRPELIQFRRSRAEVHLAAVPKVLAFLGGSDPHGYGVLLGKCLASIKEEFEATLVAPSRLHEEILRSIKNSRSSITVIESTSKLNSYFANADAIVCSAGTSSWEACFLGIPTLAICVAPNQLLTLSALEAEGLTLTQNLIDARSLDRKRIGITAAVINLIKDEKTRKSLSRNSLEKFDGLGLSRIAKILETREC